MAKRLSQPVLSGTEELLVSLMAEAKQGEETVTQMDGTEKTLPAVPFAERLRLVGVATTFLATQAKVLEDEPDAPSEFERKILSHGRTANSGNSRRRKKAQEDDGEGDGLPVASGTAFVLDALAPDPADRYRRVDGTGPGPLNGHGGADWRAGSHTGTPSLSQME